jgi:hypothetical protein
MERLNIVQRSDPQQQLLDRYCMEARTLILSANDRATALQRKEELCSRFGKECASPLLVHATREFIERLIRDRWDRE